MMQEAIHTFSWPGMFPDMYQIKNFMVVIVMQSTMIENSWILKKMQSCRNGEYTHKRVPLVEQGLLTSHEHLSSTPGFSWVLVTRSLVLCVMFCRSLFVILSFFSFGHCVVYPSSIYVFWLNLWFGIFKLFYALHQVWWASTENFEKML